MEIMAPKKAEKIKLAELETAPRLSRKIMVTETVSFAPEEMPSTKGPALRFHIRNTATSPSSRQNPRQNLDLPFLVMARLL